MIRITDSSAISLFDKDEVIAIEYLTYSKELLVTLSSGKEMRWSEISRDEFERVAKCVSGPILNGAL